MGKVILTSFGPFSGRKENGSRLVAGRIQSDVGRGIRHRTIPVRWDEISGLVADIAPDDHVLALGEGWDWHATVERHAVRRCVGRDADGQVAEYGFLVGPEVLYSDVRLPSPSPKLLAKMALPNRAGIVASVHGGHSLCNAVHYLLLKQTANAQGEQLPGAPLRGFMHLPPMLPWMRRTGQSKEAYVSTFAELVLLTLRAQLSSPL